jgi:hypothetical protein
VWELLLLFSSPFGLKYESALAFCQALGFALVSEFGSPLPFGWGSGSVSRWRLKSRTGSESA